jgi:DNA repair ATPase RecN
MPAFLILQKGWLIAQMLSGKKPTTAALENAKEMVMN